MDLTIVIPTYNRADLLDRTLTHVYEQKQIASIHYEVIVVDDGSSDHTNQVAEKFRKKHNNFRYLFRKRDKRSCRARTRNLGLKVSNGKQVTFLDTGVLIPENFINNLVTVIKKEENDKLVIYHSVLGMYIDPDKDDVSIIDSVTPNNLSQISHQLNAIPEWIDRRTGMFDFADNRLDQLSAPWSIGWTAAYSVSKSLLTLIGGFDDSFIGWGAEDTDLSYRLYKEGANFISDPNALCLHVPHSSTSESFQEKSVSNANNELTLHQKHYSFDTELYLYYPAPFYIQALNKYNNLVLSYITPRYHSTVFSFINQYLMESKKSVAIGFDGYAFLEQLSVTDVFIQNKDLKHQLQKVLPQKKFHYVLGSNTKYSDQYFDSVVFSDYFRMFSNLILEDIILELLRISKKIIIIHTHDFQPPLKSIENSQWIDFSEFCVLLEKRNIKLLSRGMVSNQEIFEITSIG